MMALLGILSLIAAAVLPTCKLFFYCFSTIFTYICTEEHGIKYGFLCYAVIAMCGFLLLPQKAAVAAYALILGYYPVIKHITERKISTRRARIFAKLAFVAASSALTAALLKLFTAFALPRAGIILLGLVVFAIYDRMLGEGIKFYALKSRR